MKLSKYIPLLLTILFTSCELYMDEAPTPKVSDAKEKAVTVNNYYGDFTYKLNADVHTMESEDYIPYLIGAEDSLLILSENTPQKLLPKVGENLFAMRSIVFPHGFAAKVKSVTKSNGMFVVETTDASLTDIFEVLDFSLDEVQLGGKEVPELGYDDEEQARTRSDEDEDEALEELYDDGTKSDNSAELFNYSCSVAIGENGEPKKGEKWGAGMGAGFSFEYKEEGYGKFDFSLSKMTVMAQVTLTDTYEFNFSVQKSGKFNIYNNSKVLDKNFYIFGSLPIALNVALGLTIDVEVTGKVEYTYSKTNTTTIGYEADLNNGKINKIKSKDKDEETSSSSHSISGEGEVAVPVKVTLDVSVALCNRLMKVGISLGVVLKPSLSINITMSDIGGENFGINSNPNIDFSIVFTVGLFLEFNLKKSAPMYDTIIIKLDKLVKMANSKPLPFKDPIRVDVTVFNWDVLKLSKYLLPVLDELSFSVYSEGTTPDLTIANFCGSYAFKDNGMLPAKHPQLLIIDDEGKAVVVVDGKNSKGEIYTGDIESKELYTFDFNLPNDGRTYSAYPIYKTAVFGKITEKAQKFAANKGEMYAMDFSQLYGYKYDEPEIDYDPESDEWVPTGKYTSIYDFAFNTTFKLNGNKRIKDWRFNLLIYDKNNKEIYQKTLVISNPKMKNYIVAKFEMTTNAAPPLKVRVAPLAKQKTIDGKETSVVFDRISGELIEGEFYDFTDPDVVFNGENSIGVAD